MRGWGCSAEPALVSTPEVGAFSDTRRDLATGTLQAEAATSMVAEDEKDRTVLGRKKLSKQLVAAKGFPVTWRGCAAESEFFRATRPSLT